MMVCYMLALVCLFSATTYFHGDAYVLKRSSNSYSQLDDDDDSNQLTEALKVIARERRRLKEAEDDLYNDYYWQQEDEKPVNYDSSDFLQDLFGEIEDENGEEDSEPILPQDIDPRIFSSHSSESIEPEDEEETPVDDSELEDIFDSDNGDNPLEDTKDKDEDEDKKEDKRTIPWQLGGSGGLNDKPDKKSSDDVDEEDGTTTELSTDEVAELLKDADDVEQEELAKEEADEEAEAEDESAEPVSEEELKSMLEGDETDETEDTPDIDQVSDDNQVEYDDFPSTEDLSKEWLLNQYIQQQQPLSSKKKRSGGDVFDEENALIDQDFDDEEIPDIEDLSEQGDDKFSVEIEDTLEECMRRFIALEDMENTKLAEALSFATLGQVEKTDRYIPQEVNYLKDAVDYEEEIKDLRRCLSIWSKTKRGTSKRSQEEPLFDEDQGSDEEVEDVDEETVEEPMGSQEMVEEIPEQTQDADIRDMLAEKLKLYLLRNSQLGDQMEPEIEEETEDVDDPTLNPFYRELYEQYGSDNDVEKRGYEEEEEMLDPRDEDEEAEEEEELANEIRGRLGNYIAEMTPGQRRELKNEVAEALEAIADEDASVCPAIDLYTNNCEAAVSKGLTLDDEAMNLCNRHQLCYACGGSINLDYKDCDKGYLEVAERLCEGDKDCEDEAAGLFMLMARGHEYVAPSYAHERSECRAQCVVDFIVGSDGDDDEDEL